MARKYVKRDQSVAVFPIVSVTGISIRILGGNVNRANDTVSIPSAKINLSDDAVNYVMVDWESMEVISNVEGWLPRCIPLYTITTSEGHIIDTTDARGMLRQSAHSEHATLDEWLYDVVVTSDTGWADLDLSNKVAVPSGATGVVLEVNVKEEGEVGAGDAPYLLFRRPGDSSQSQWKIVVPQVSGRWFPRTVNIRLGEDGKTIQYNANVTSSLHVKVALAGWVFG